VQQAYSSDSVLEFLIEKVIKILVIHLSY